MDTSSGPNDTLIINAVLGYVSYLARDNDSAIVQCQRTVELDPGFGITHFVLGLAYQQKGMFQEAIAELHQAVALSNGATMTLGFGNLVLHIFGR